MTDQVEIQLMEVLKSTVSGDLPAEQAIAVARVAREYTRRREMYLRELDLRHRIAKDTRTLRAPLPQLEDMAPHIAVA